ncbi:MAG: DegV family protein [Woeseiaceae bacterium]|nr:DegV family protein [Woeseiaceae bacterium]
MNDLVESHLDGDALANALTSGIHRVIKEQEHLNSINVFPVADGDTGTNMSLSLGAGLPVLNADGEKHLGTMLAALADAMLDGARGNSGAIMAQFFQGMSDSAGETSRFTPYTFGKAIAQGSDYAHDALSKPREGTVLSVIAALAASLHKQTIDNNEQSFSSVMPEALKSLQTALEKTPDQLDVLRKAGVVDAGAKGFVALFSGMTDYVMSGEIEAKPDLSEIITDANIITAGDASDSKFRYCTECIVTGDDIDRRKLRESLAEMGDSLVLAGTKRKARIHIHVNDPDDVFTLARQFGAVSAEKADDMHRQVHGSHDRGRKFAVVVDSAADIPEHLLEQHDIHVVPIRIQFGERGYLDKVSITAEEFFEELASNPTHPTTSQPAPGDFRRQFQFLASHYPDVLSINVTRKASGTMQAAEAAAERVNAHGRMHTFDSRNASLGQGLLAVYAARCSEAGVDIETTLEQLDELRAETQTFGILNDLRFAVRGGRVPGWVKVVADLLRLLAIIKTVPDGRIASGAFLIGKRQRAKRFANYVGKHAPKDVPVNIAIGHAVAPQDAEIIAETLRGRVDNIEQLTISELGTAFGVHGGPGTLVVAVQPARALPVPAG